MGTPYTVTRSTTVEAPAEAVRALLRDFRQWPRWSPWEELDPQMRRTYSGAEAGVGARYAWEGNRKAGRGSMEVVGDAAHEVDVALSFEKPFPSQSRVEFVLTPQGASTGVEWRMVGELSTMMRLFSVVKSMDSLVGPDMEKGLARLRTAAEGSPA